MIKSLRYVSILAAFSVTVCFSGTFSAYAANGNFNSWLSGVKKEALKKGISKKTLKKAFKNTKPIKRILELDKKQPEFRKDYWDYVDKVINDARVKKGRKLLKKHRVLLGDIQHLYGVPAKYIVALWGIETNYGSNFGGFPVIDALATLAYDNRRADFFRSELFHALKILEKGDISYEKMMGSWAGAMGNFQFMPSTFTYHAVDHNGDKKRDIWGSIHDSFASAANYLARMGWYSDETWGREIKIPKNFDLDLVGLDTKKTVREWQKLGVRQPNGKKIAFTNTSMDIKASVVLPSGYEGPAYLVYNNFNMIMRWNRSLFYALSVCQLADRISGQPAVKRTKTARKEKPLLSSKDIKKLQVMLNKFGLNAGKPDGMFGRKTREATREMQKKLKMPADGYPTVSLLERLSRKNPFASVKPRKLGRKKLKQIQKRLASLRIYKGKADGIFGKGTLRAVKKFQKNKGLVEDGYLSDEMIRKIMKKKEVSKTLVKPLHKPDISIPVPVRKPVKEESVVIPERKPDIRK